MEKKDLTGNLYLTGFMGAGKTSVGRELAKQLGLKFIDTDHEIERQVGMSIPELFVKEGEKVFRSLETQIVDQLKDQSGFVVALGGGTFMDPENRKKIMESGTVIYLKVDLEESLDRIDQSDRPLASSAVVLFHDRISTYEEAHLHIDASSSPEETAKKIVEKIQ